jgi:hypothetical protein
VGAFLEAPRDAAFAALARAWHTSTTIDELGWLCGLEIEGQLKRNPRIPRARLTDILLPLSTTDWLDMDEFIDWVKTCQPDFLRARGEYDAWIIRETAAGGYRKGFEHWDQVEGAYLRAMLTGPFFWLGLVELGSKARAKKPNLFRRSQWAADLLAGKEAACGRAEVPIFTIQKDGSLLIERGFSLSARYQLARFCEWKAPRKGNYCYQISPSA